MWFRIWALAMKEFLALLRDKKGRFIVIAPPILQLFLFGYAATFDLNHINYAVYNEDSGFASRELLGHFEGSTIFRKVVELHSNKEFSSMINNQNVLLILHIDRNFTRDLLHHNPATTQVIVDGRNSNTATIAQNYVNSIIQSFSTQWMNKYHWGNLPAELKIRAWYNPNLISRWLFVPGIVAIIMLLITLLVTGLSIAREREQGTFDQLLVTPMTPLEILIGKSLPGLIIGLIEGTLIILVAVVWFRIPFVGSVLALSIGMFLFLMAAIGIGLMISSLAMTQQQGLLGVFMFMVPAIQLSGFATPIANMPHAVQMMTYINPLRYLLIIARGVFLEGDDVTHLWSQYWPLALIGLVTMMFAMRMFRHRI